jgi:hypothetical protein
MNVESFDIASGVPELFRQLQDELYAGDPYYQGSSAPAPQCKGKTFIAFENDKAAGRIGAVLNDFIRYEGTAAGLIGWYECLDNEGAAGVLLSNAESYLKNVGCKWIIGPMNGSTWYSYRLTQPSDNPPFFLDNHHKPWYQDQFITAGYEPMSYFHTVKVNLQQKSDERIERFEHVLKKRGVTVRQLNPDHFEEELEKIYLICSLSFVDNFLYSPISFEKFKELYLRIRPCIDPTLVLIAENSQSVPVGFIFTVPNHFENPIASAIVKTVAIVPDGGVKGLGTYMVAITHKRLLEAGCTSVFHALMHESNISTNILSENSEIYHRYVLYGKHL